MLIMRIMWIFMQYNLWKQLIHLSHSLETTFLASSFLRIRPFLTSCNNIKYFKIWAIWMMFIFLKPMGIMIPQNQLSKVEIHNKWNKRYISKLMLIARWFNNCFSCRNKKKTKRVKRSDHVFSPTSMMESVMNAYKYLSLIHCFNSHPRISPQIIGWGYLRPHWTDIHVWGTEVIN